MLAVDSKTLEFGMSELSMECHTKEEEALAHDYLSQGYVVRPVASQDSLHEIRTFIAKKTASFFHEDGVGDPLDFLNHVHRHVDPQNLNALRVKLIGSVLSEKHFRAHYYRMSRPLLDSIVGNEVVMQRGIGLSIQLPQDDSSLLNVHSDTWSGDSPFESVVWLPLVDCYKTKAMFICTSERSKEVNQNFARYQKLNNKQFLKELSSDLTFIEVPYGSVLVFNQNLLHGNVLNEETETRWSMNCRFKSVFSPYCDKKLGEFFEPINLKPATQIGLAYQYPKVQG